MLKRISILLLICFSSLCALGQTEKYTVPVKWEKYKDSDKGFSILFPKLPVLTEHPTACSEIVTNKYAAYAEGIVYGLDINFKSKQKIPDSCSGIERVIFDEKSFEVRLKEIKTFLKVGNETKFTLNNAEAIKVKGSWFTYWFVNDFKNKRWFEIWATDKDETDATVKNFIESFKTEKNLSGIEIGKGADRTLGDETTSDKIAATSSEKTPPNSDNGETSPIRIILKPCPRYTDAAKDKQVQGDVLLKVVFLANGGIGSITPVNTLPFGLTEQAIAAARKIFFTPPQKNGVKYSVAKQVQYHFTIY